MTTSHYRMTKYVNLVILGVQYITIYAQQATYGSYIMLTKSPKIILMVPFLIVGHKIIMSIIMFLIVLQRDKRAASEMSNVGGR